MPDITLTAYFPQDPENYAPWVAEYGLYFEYGKCQCGCDQVTSASSYTSSRDKVFAGYPTRFIHNHHSTLRRLLAPGPNPSGLCQCGCGAITPIAAKTGHGCVQGKHVRYIPGHQIRDNVFPKADVRFWEKVAKAGPNDCWLWTASTYLNGYGQFWTGTNLTPAHRYSYFLAHGEIPISKVVCHNCPSGDNPLCVNPAHLWLGTQKENVADMHEKGRDNKARGERQRNAKLTDEIVLQIRDTHAKGGYSYRQLARMMGVTMPTIRSIVLRETWKHI